MIGAYQGGSPSPRARMMPARMAQKCAKTWGTLPISLIYYQIIPWITPTRNTVAARVNRAMPARVVLRLGVRAGHDGPALGVPQLSPQELGGCEDPQERAVAPLLAVFPLRQEPLEDGGVSRSLLLSTKTPALSAARERQAPLALATKRAPAAPPSTAHWRAASSSQRGPCAARPSRRAGPCAP